MEEPRKIIDYRDGGIRGPAYLSLWSLYILGTFIGFFVVGPAAWRAITGHAPDSGAVFFFGIGIVFTTVVAALFAMTVKRTRYLSPMVSLLTLFVMGLSSPLFGIVLAYALT
jgi:hypothetical protein